MAIKVGIQLFSIRNELAKDPFPTLKKVSEIGYKYIEPANHAMDKSDGVGFDMSAEDFKKTMDECNLQIVGCHLFPLLPERLPAILKYQETIGNHNVGVAMDVFPYNDMEYLQKRCELYNEMGRICKEHGMRFYYHNHYEEFQEFGDVTVYDYIMEHTDPELVYIEMDLYWIARAGKDPIDYIRRYKDRIIRIHQKDFPGDCVQPMDMFNGVIRKDANIDMTLFNATKYESAFTEVGTGILPIQDYITELQNCPNLEYIILEQDNTAMPSEFDSIQTSMDAFRRFKGISWD